MDDKQIRKLKRVDLLEMLIDQSKEVRRLKLERDALIEETRHYKEEFDKVGSLSAILSGLGVPTDGILDDSRMTAFDELLLQYENEESTSELFEESDNT